jgi:hypothetical protein
MRIAGLKSTASVALVAALSMVAGGRAEAAAFFCDGPIHEPFFSYWCDPFVDEIRTYFAGDPAPIVYPSDPANIPADAPACLAVHVKNTKSVPSPIGVGRDANNNAFFAPFTGQLPVGESVGYVASRSLGTVTRNAANGGMPHGVRVDDPALDGKPQAILVATRAATPGASVSAVGAWYDGQRWWLYNEDLSPMGPAETFFYAEGTSTGGSAVHTQGNDYQGIGLYLDDARINGRPSAVVVPLHAFTGAYNASALGVWYDAAVGQWVVYNESGSALAPGQTIHYVAIP